MKAIFDVIYVEALSIICYYSPLFPLAGVDSQSMSDDDRGHRVIKIKWSNQISFLQRAVHSLQSVHNGSITLRREESVTWWRGLMRTGKSKSDRESLRGSFNTNGHSYSREEMGVDIRVATGTLTCPSIYVIVQTLGGEFTAFWRIVDTSARADRERRVSPFTNMTLPGHHNPVMELVSQDKW